MEPEPIPQPEFDGDQTWKTSTADPDATWPNAERRSAEEPLPAADDARA